VVSCANRDVWQLELLCMARFAEQCIKQTWGALVAVDDLFAQVGSGDPVRPFFAEGAGPALVRSDIDT
jgi:hypothetical protein